MKPSYWEICPGAANAAGQNLTLSLAGQYGKNNISFVAVNPGPVRTERWAGLVKAMSRDMKISYEEADKLAPASIPMGRIAEVDEVANLGGDAGLAADGNGQRHHDRNRRRSGQAADGPFPRQADGANADLDVRERYGRLDKLGAAVGLFAYKQVRRPEATEPTA